jgi:hypothetical protein
VSDDPELGPGRALEAEGRLDEAVVEYLRVGAHDEAARLLASRERYGDAARLVLEGLGISADGAGDLEGPARQSALRAARWFELGGDAESAARLRRSLGLETGGEAKPANRLLVKRSIAPDPRASGLLRREPVPSAAPAPRPASAAPPPHAPAPAAAPPAHAPPPPAAPPPDAPPPAAAVAAPPAAPAPRAASVAPPARPPSEPPRPASVPPPGAARRAAPSPPRPVAAARAQSGTDGSLQGEKWGRAKGWRGGGGSGAQDAMIKQLLDQGKKSAAARVAWDAGRLEDAAKWFAESGMDYETGAVLYDLGMDADALETLLRVKPDHKKHRVACTKIVDLATKLGRFDFEIDRLLSQFAKAPPVEAAEVATYLALAELHAKNGFPDGARRVLDQVLLFDSGHEGARTALERLPVPEKRGDARRKWKFEPTGPRALPPLPTLEDFVADAKKHAPPKQAR